MNYRLIILFLLIIIVSSCSKDNNGMNLSKGLIAYYPFSGSAEDKSGNNLNGTVNGATLTSDRSSKANSAYYFDGTSYIEVANDTLLNFNNNFTFAVWINLEQAKTYGCRIIDKSVGSTNYGFLLDTYDTNLTGREIRFFVGDAWKYHSASLLDLNKWYFIVTTYRDGVGSVYINGELNFQNSSSSIFQIITSKTPMRFGFDTGVRTGPDFDDSFVGKIDDIRIYNRVLTDSEIKYLFSN